MLPGVVAVEHHGRGHWASLAIAHAEVWGRSVRSVSRVRERARQLVQRLSDIGLQARASGVVAAVQFAQRVAKGFDRLFHDLFVLCLAAGLCRNAQYHE